MLSRYLVAIVISINVLFLIPVPSYSSTVNYTYDERDRIRTVTYSDGTILEYYYDFIGNRSSKVVTNPYVIDTTINSYPSKSARNISATFGFTASQTGASFECLIDGGNYIPCTSPYTYNNLSPGDHIFKVRAKDVNGKYDSSPAIYSWTIDVTPPHTTITSTPLATSNTASGSFTFTSPENNASFQCQIDGGSFNWCSNPYNFTLSNGAHVFSVRSIDQAGNIDPTPATYTWTISMPLPPPPQPVPAMSMPVLVFTGIGLLGIMLRFERKRRKG